MNRSIKIPGNITFESIDENIYILNIDDGEYYELSKSASEIWNQIEKGVDIKDIKLNLKSSFENNENIDYDVDELITYFINVGLLKDN